MPRYSVQLVPVRTGPGGQPGWLKGTFHYKLVRDDATLIEGDLEVETQASSMDAVQEEARRQLTSALQAWGSSGGVAEPGVPRKLAFAPPVVPAPLPAAGSADGPGADMAQKIDNVVVLMLENRGFDHALGWLYDGDAPQLNLPAANVPANQVGLRKFEGLSGLDPDTLVNGLATSLGGDRVLALALSPRKGARAPNVPSQNPHEDYEHILSQIFNKPYDRLPEGWPPLQFPADTKFPMNGYVQDFATNFGPGWPAKLDQIGEIMDTYLPEQLPVLNGLAKHYGCSDLWFCSVPTQTNANRAFSLGGTSRGMVKNDFYGVLASDSLPQDTRTLFHVLDENGKANDWGYFSHGRWPPVVGSQYARKLFPSLGASKFDQNFATMDIFFARAKDGTLPPVTFIEPKWGGGPDWPPSLEGNDMHPVCDTTTAEQFVKSVYDALTAGPKWSKTLFIITFDENGGTYDHLAPDPNRWPCLPSGLDQAPPSNTERTKDPVTLTQYGFRFNMYGIRVPTIFVSPFVAPATVVRSPTTTPFDHTSLIATLLEWRGLSDRSRWNLGDRVAAAPSFASVLSLDAPRLAADPDYGTRFGTVKRAAGATPIKYGDIVKLKYIGNRWDANRPSDQGPPNPRYLSFFKQGFSPLGQYYPRVGAGMQAARLKLVGGVVGQPVMNNAVLQIVTTEEGVGAYNTLGAWTTDRYLYYYTPGDAKQDWTVRMASYVNSDKSICSGDDVIFFSNAFSTDLNFQRLDVDTKLPEYLTTRRGVWAYWQIEPT